MAREKFTTRTIVLWGDVQRETLYALVPNLPIDAARPIEVIIREKVNKRGLDANARMWAGPLRDIAEQAWIDGRQFSAETWAKFFKKEFLPEDDAPEDGRVKDGYRKWGFAPDGERVLIGSTTQLTVRGFALYVQELEAFGANLGVEFTASPNETRGYE